MKLLTPFAPRPVPLPTPCTPLLMPLLLPDRWSEEVPLMDGDCGTGRRLEAGRA